MPVNARKGPECGLAVWLATDLALAVLAYLYPPGRSADDRKMVRFGAARVIRRAARAAS